MREIQRCPETGVDPLILAYAIEIVDACHVDVGLPLGHHRALRPELIGGVGLQPAIVVARLKTVLRPVGRRALIGDQVQKGPSAVVVDTGQCGGTGEGLPIQGSRVFPVVEVGRMQIVRLASLLSVVCFRPWTPVPFRKR